MVIFKRYVFCDVCHLPVKGARPPRYGYFTAGYYSGWFGIRHCCDHCMWTKNQQYAEMYGYMKCLCFRCRFKDSIYRNQLRRKK